MNKLQTSGGLPFYYWFLSGLVIGLIGGWFFHGTINFIIRTALLIGIIVVIGLIIYLWKRGPRPGSKSASADDIPEGSWRNIDPTGRK